MTNYKHRFTCCVQADSADDANQLALLVGESQHDDQTFDAVTHTKDGVEYMCISTVVTDTFVSIESNGLPHDTLHGKPADREAALRAFAVADYRLTEADTLASDVLADMGYEALDGED